MAASMWSRSDELAEVLLGVFDLARDLGALGLKRTCDQKSATDNIC
jgi:hypothetical protein